MPYYVIERQIPGAGSKSPEQLQAAIDNSVSTLKELGRDIQWIHSFVTDDKVYCIYLSPDETLIRDHSRETGMPADRVSAVRSLMSAEGLLDPEELSA